MPVAVAFKGNYLPHTPRKTILAAAFPSLGWTESFDVPEELIGSTILFVGSAPDTTELVLDYRTKGGEEKRLVLGFTERGMWIESIGRCPASNQGASGE